MCSGRPWIRAQRDVTAASHAQLRFLVVVECCCIKSESVVRCLGCEVVNPPVLGYNGTFLFSFLMHKCDFKPGFPEILRMADAAQCLVEFAGPSKLTYISFLSSRVLLSLGSCRRHRENNLLNLSALQRMKWTICCALDSSREKYLQIDSAFMMVLLMSICWLWFDI